MATPQQSRELLDNFLNHLNGFYKELGVFSDEKNKEQALLEIMNRFYSNLICLQNHLLAKDSLSATLIQRYNNELTVDFYYILDPGGEKDKIKNFFNHKIVEREWSKIDKAEKRKFVPPWVMGQDTYKEHFKILSNLAHPNIISLRLNRRGVESEFSTIKDAICLCIFEISLCLNDKRFQEFFSGIDWPNLYFKTLEFKNQAGVLLSEK